MTSLEVQPRTFMPVEDRVVLKPIDAEGDQMHGSIVIPEVAREKPQEAIVVAIGPLAQVRTGARVLFGKYSGTEVTIDGTDYIVMRYTDLLLVFND